MINCSDSLHENGTNAVVKTNTGVRVFCNDGRVGLLSDTTRPTTRLGGKYFLLGTIGKLFEFE